MGGEHEVDCTDLVDLSMLVPVYLTAIPVDPQGSEETIVSLGKLINKVYAATNGTNYWIKKNSTGKIIETTADGAELGVTISIPAGISNSGGDDEEEENSSCGGLSSITDPRDNQVYSIVSIGDQCWMRENINVGTMVDSVNNQGTSCNSIEKYCYGNSSSNCSNYGGLYQWNQAMCGSTSAGSQGICPDGWHIPSDIDYKDLELVLGMDQEQLDIVGWRATDEVLALRSGLFSADLVGYRLTSGSTVGLGNVTMFFSSTEYHTPDNVYSRYLELEDHRVLRSNYGKSWGGSIRCLMD